jgi:hypothetical protein
MLVKFEGEKEMSNRLETTDQEQSLRMVQAIILHGLFHISTQE